MADPAPISLTALHVYPLKGARGLAPGAARAERRGFAGDRRWMIVDEAGTFVSQRTRPALARLAPERRDDAFVLRAPGQAELVVPLAAGGRPLDAAPCPVTIWRDTVDALDAGEAAAAWLAARLGEPCRLVFMPDETERPVDPAFAAPADRVGFADAFPYLLASEASLADLNARLPRPLPMDRFRPNLVIAGAAPYAEDGWRRVRIGTVAFRVAKPCARCAVTTVDQATGIASGPEPLRALAAYRRGAEGVLFGMNLIPDGEGELRRGDPVEPLA